MMKIYCLSFLLFLTAISASAQIGSYGVYKFINLPVSSRTAALGGNLISVKDDDVSLAVQNPSLLNPTMNDKVALSYISYLADINFGSIVYAHNVDSIGTFSGGMQYISYGDFVKADEAGNKLGTFRAAEYNFFMGFSRQWKQFSYGGQLKFIYSQLEAYRSTGLAADIAGTYYNEKKRFTATIVFRNIGAQLKPYADTREPLPFEIQAGISYKPLHMPFRFSVIAHDLQKPDLSYINSNIPLEKDLNGTVIPQNILLVDKIARHLIIGAELIAGKVLKIQVGYNDQRRMELSIPGLRGATGFSFGMNINLGKYYIAYGKSFMHVAGSSDTFTFGVNIGQLMAKRVENHVEDNNKQ
jgi:hypothetical protein